MIEYIFDENNEVDIASLSEYIGLFETIEQNKSYPSPSCGTCLLTMQKEERLVKANYIYRGENQWYERIAASAFRYGKKMRPQLIDALTNTQCKDMEYPIFMNAIDDFYRQVSHDLEQTEKDNFIAFSQHHGLPTNLLDVTTSPLSALFFACHGAHKDCGYVYIFENFIDITDIVYSNPNSNILDLLKKNDKQTISIMSSLLSKYWHEIRSENRINGHIRSLCLVLHEKFKEQKCDYVWINWQGKLTAIAEQAEKVSNACIEERLEPRRKELNELIRLIMEYSDSNDIALPINYHKSLTGNPRIQHALKNLGLSYIDYQRNAYLVLLVFLLNIPTTDNLENTLPYMLYRPKENFKRMRIQQGLFIYQPFVNLSDGNYDTKIRLVQEIKHSKVIKVKNQHKILQQLDCLGINQGTIYGDFDSIAKHIKHKHSL